MASDHAIDSTLETPKTSALSIGAMIDGRYRIEALLGEGGFGVVYKATQISTGQPVAIKLLLTERLTGKKADSAAARFERELRLIAQLKHQHIVRLIDSGHLDDGRMFTVLEFIEGVSLRDMLARGGRMDAKTAMRVMRQVLEALGHAHDQGVVHRDLKPENIMITETGYGPNVTVLDFGISAIMTPHRNTDYRTITRANEFFGTPNYMAPELIERSELTPASDIYSWGLVFLECLSGEVAIDSESLFEVVVMQVSDEPVALSHHVPPALRMPLEQALAKKVEHRFATVRDVMTSLDRVDLDGPRVDSVPRVNLASLTAGDRAFVYGNTAEESAPTEMATMKLSAQELEPDKASMTRAIAYAVMIGLLAVAAFAAVWFGLR